MFTTSAKNHVMNAIFRGVTGVLPTSLSVGLSTTEPSSNGAGITEPNSATGYKRVSNVPFGAASGGIVANESVISFPTFVANAGVATHYVLFDQNGIPFWYGELASSKHMEIDDIFAFKIGDLRIELNDME